MSRSILAVPSLGLVLTVLACGGGQKPATSAQGAGASSDDHPAKVVIEEGTEVWYDEASAPASDGGKASTTREYYGDVTRSTGVKDDPSVPRVIKKYRVIVRFPVPKVQPPTARDPHSVNRAIWEARKQIAACFYKGPGREPGAEMSMIGYLMIAKAGAVTDAGVESADDALHATGAVDECIMENLKGLTLIAAGDDVKVRFKLKLQTIDGEGLADFKEPEKKD